MQKCDISFFWNLDTKYARPQFFNISTSLFPFLSISIVLHLHRKKKEKKRNNNKNNNSDGIKQNKL